MRNGGNQASNEEAALGKRSSAIVLLGPPGSGKTTLARALSKVYPIAIVGIGSLLAREVRENTALGSILKPYTSAGKLAPIDLVEDILTRELRTIHSEVVAFDGIPRAASQIDPFFRILDRHGMRLRAIIVLTLDLPTVLARLAARRVCSRCGALYNVPPGDPAEAAQCERCGGELRQRPDDREEVIRGRYQRYQHETLPVVDYFKRECAPMVIEQSAAQPKKERTRIIATRLESLLSLNEGAR